MAIRGVKHLVTAEDIAAKRYEVNQYFTPSTPVTSAELFANRPGQMVRMVDAVAERGRHVILFGERGVGKTSLAQIVPYIIPGRQDLIRYFRVPAFPQDNFHSLARKIFKKIKFRADIGDGEQEYNAADLYNETITPDDFINEFGRQFNENDIPIIVIDEFQEIEDKRTPALFAQTLKALSDEPSNVATLVIVGVADNVRELIDKHESLERCIEEILMPRMGKKELIEVLTKRLTRLEFTIEGDAKWKIVNLAKGLPAYVHSLGKNACLKALGNGGKLHIVEADVDAAIDTLLSGAEQSFKANYEAATRSNQPGTLLRHTLTACALAKTDDESGYFVPSAIREPLSAILGRSVEIANFQNHLKAFIDPDRKSILQRIGAPRAYRFRFSRPAMQPYVIMRGIKEGILDEKAKRALSYPEQPDLFANETEPPSSR